MVRYQFIEQIQRQIYNGESTADANITINLINQYLNEGIGVAVKQNYNDSIRLDGVAYVNGSFYTTFRNISITVGAESGLYKAILPQVPIGIGKNEGIISVKIKSVSDISFPLVSITVSQENYFDSLAKLNKIPYWNEGDIIYFKSPFVNLTGNTVIIRMVSGGDSTDLNSTLLIPDDYIPVIVEYIKSQLVFERAQTQDIQNDGRDSNK